MKIQKMEQLLIPFEISIKKGSTIEIIRVKANSYDYVGNAAVFYQLFKIVGSNKEEKIRRIPFFSILNPGQIKMSGMESFVEVGGSIFLHDDVVEDDSNAEDNNFDDFIDEEVVEFKKEEPEQSQEITKVSEQTQFALDSINRRLNIDNSSSTEERAVKTELHNLLYKHLTEYLTRTKERFNLNAFFNFFSERISSDFGATKEVVEVDICNMIMNNDVGYQRFYNKEVNAVLNKNKQAIRLRSFSQPQVIFEYLMNNGVGDMRMVTLIDICVYLKREMKR
jgi:hypothetical protein